LLFLPAVLLYQLVYSYRIAIKLIPKSINLKIIKNDKILTIGQKIKQGKKNFIEAYLKQEETLS
jgi:hypothetical protein